MGKLLSILSDNPLIFIWVAVIAFGVGVTSGAATVFHFENVRLNAMKQKYDQFVASTQAAGELAKKQAEAKAKSDLNLKESSDREYEAVIARLHANIKRMRNSRPTSSFVPTSTSGTRNPKVVCFDRTDLELSLQHLDAGVSRLIEKGDESSAGLNVARHWVAGIGSNTSPRNRASSSI